MSDPATQEYLTPAEVAGMLRVSTSAVHKALARGQIPYLPFGTRKLVRRADLAAWIEKHIVGGKAS
jgi:excisionase family DNA binding protein